MGTVEVRVEVLEFEDGSSARVVELSLVLSHEGQLRPLRPFILPSLSLRHSLHTPESALVLFPVFDDRCVLLQLRLDELRNSFLVAGRQVSLEQNVNQ